MAATHLYAELPDWTGAHGRPFVALVIDDDRKKTIHTTQALMAAPFAGSTGSIAFDAGLAFEGKAALTLERFATQSFLAYAAGYRAAAGAEPENLLLVVDQSALELTKKSLRQFAKHVADWRDKRNYSTIVSVQAGTSITELLTVADIVCVGHWKAARVGKKKVPVELFEFLRDRALNGDSKSPDRDMVAYWADTWKSLKKDRANKLLWVRAGDETYGELFRIRPYAGAGDHDLEHEQWLCPVPSATVTAARPPRPATVPGTRRPAARS